MATVTKWKQKQIGETANSNILWNSFFIEFLLLLNPNLTILKKSKNYFDAEDFVKTDSKVSQQMLDSANLRFYGVIKHQIHRPKHTLSWNANRKRECVEGERKSKHIRRKIYIKKLWNEVLMRREREKTWERKRIQKDSSNYWEKAERKKLQYGEGTLNWVCNKQTENSKLNGGWYL